MTRNSARQAASDSEVVAAGDSFQAAMFPSGREGVRAIAAWSDLPWRGDDRSSPTSRRCQPIMPFCMA